MRRNYVTKLAPDGKDAPDAPYYGGGIYGAGFGITLDANGNAMAWQLRFPGYEACIHASGT